MKRRCNEPLPNRGDPSPFDPLMGWCPECHCYHAAGFKSCRLLRGSMRLTVVITDTGTAANIGGPVTYRRVTVELTPEQEKALKLQNEWEAYGTTFIEPEVHTIREG